MLYLLLPQRRLRCHRCRFLPQVLLLPDIPFLPFLKISQALWLHLYKGAKHLLQEGQVCRCGPPSSPPIVSLPSSQHHAMWGLPVYLLSKHLSYYDPFVYPFFRCRYDFFFYIFKVAFYIASCRIHMAAAAEFH